MKTHIDQPLSAILSLNTVAHTIGAAGVGAQVVKVFGEAAFGIASAILTLLILVFTEIIPPLLMLRNLTLCCEHILALLFISINKLFIEIFD